MECACNSASKGAVTGRGDRREGRASAASSGRESLSGCTLDADQLRDRGVRWNRILKRAALGSQRTSKSVVIRFQGGSATRVELDRLVKLEKECCSHLAWKVAARGSEWVLTVRGSRQGLAQLATAAGL